MNRKLTLPPSKIFRSEPVEIKSITVSIKKKAPVEAELKTPPAGIKLDNTRIPQDALGTEAPVFRARTSHRKTRLLLADDHEILLEALRQLLGKTFDVVGCASDGAELVTLAQRHKPDVFVVDINMPRMNGLKAIEQIRALGVDARPVFLTVLDDGKLVLKAFEAGGGIVGYVLKNSAGNELTVAIQEVLAGRSYISPRITSGVLHECLHRVQQLPEGLTSRQAEVLRLIAQGKTMKEVASVLNISTRTAEAHKYQMMHQLGMRTCAELIQFAVHEGLAPVNQASFTFGVSEAG
jgi:DNA-binding NarL/FixJ family response regulator